MTNRSILRPGKRSVLLALAVLGAMAVALAVISAFALPAEAARERVGPRVPSHGYPLYYQDSNGLRLELCIDGPPLCLEGLPNPNQPASVAPNPANSNFPEEAFWWAAEASMPTRNGGDALLVLAREAAFGGADEAVRRGDQVSFSRVRIRVDNLVPGATYTVTHPYGVDTFRNVEGGVRGINFTEDIGCALSPNPNAPGCNFRDALFGRVDPFLTWDPAFAPAPPRGYVGDPGRPHRVVGSPRGTNFFRIVGPNVGGPGDNSIQTSLFAVQGKIAGRIPTRLTLRAIPGRIQAGQGHRLEGRLTFFRRAIAGREVVIERRPRGATEFLPLKNGTRTTANDGTFTLRGVRPARNTVYRATFAGEAPSAASAGFQSSRGSDFVRVLR